MLKPSTLQNCRALRRRKPSWLSSYKTQPILSRNHRGWSRRWRINWQCWRSNNDWTQRVRMIRLWSSTKTRRLYSISCVSRNASSLTKRTIMTRRWLCSRPRMSFWISNERITRRKWRRPAVDLRWLCNKFRSRRKVTVRTTTWSCRRSNKSTRSRWQRAMKLINEWLTSCKNRWSTFTMKTSSSRVPPTCRCRPSRLTILTSWRK